MKRVRSFKSDSNKLDDNLISLQEQGYSITQILPCPESMSCESKSVKSESFDVGVDMKFMIIFLEEKEDKE